MNNGSNGSNEKEGCENRFRRKVGEYGVGCVVWRKDSSVRERVEIGVGGWV